jgi:NAD(P)-dependent dehydrogenase (short-subunit alcohol dehydrogenase family)
MTKREGGRFTGKAFVISGGARGIGAKTAECLVGEGGKVVIADTDESLGKPLAAKLGANARFLLTDVADPAACGAAVRLAVEEFGGLDGAVNSAIRMGPGALKDLALEDWNKVVSVGLTGTFLMAQAAGRWMIDNGRRGSIVNISSIGGIAPYAMAGAYSTVKAAVIMLSKHMGLEWAPKGVRVNAVCPGHIETPLTVYLKDPEIMRGRSEVTPLKRVGQPIDIANAILFLLSDEADYITATSLGVDGGLAVSVMNHLPGRKWD